MPRKSAAENFIPSAKLYITFQEIYEALEKNGYPASAGNVVKLCRHIEGRAGDFARDCLADWAERPTNLDEEEETKQYEIY